MKSKIALIFVIVIAIILAALVFDWGRGTVQAPNHDGNTSTSTATSSVELPVVLSYPQENQEVTNPIQIKGIARGTWFFEASFPIQLVDSAGNIIAQGHAQAEDDWMTTNYVNFSAEIAYPATTTGSALLVLSKDNPSGLPEFDAHIFVPVILK
jgi:hypothetical protein